jgi:uncharacterized protein (DUF1501 family)
MSNDDILLVIFLRGGCDGLNLVGPSADPIYKTERRPETRVERDGDHPGIVLPNTLADVDFRFHFKAQPLKDLYDAKHLAIVHACGLTNGTRSHFEATDYMERGTPENKNTPTGWLTRLASGERLAGLTPVISTSNSLPTSLLSCGSAVAVPNAKKMALQGDGHYKALRESLLKTRYKGSSPVAVSGVRTLQVLDIFANRLPKDAHGKLMDYTPSANANYPGDGYAGELTNSLKTLAQLIKMDVGVRLATADYGGWDTHVGQGGRFPNLVDGLSRAIAAFWIDMRSYQDRLTIVVMSEFGRRLKGNDSGGTDHGHGNVMLVLGGHVRGGNMYGRWPGLANDQLDNQVDLAVTTDYRNVLGEIAMKRFNHPHMNAIFPGLSPEPVGIIT